MLTSIRGLLAATVIATSAFAAAPALAQDEEAGPVTVTGSVTAGGARRIAEIDPTRNLIAYLYRLDGSLGRIESADQGIRQHFVFALVDG